MKTVKNKLHCTISDSVYFLRYNFDSATREVERKLNHREHPIGTRAFIYEETKTGRELVFFSRKVNTFV